MKIYTSISQLVGHTPLLELKNIESKLGLKAKLIAKLEYLNPAGSVKDRAALSMINEAIKKGTLKPDSVIIEPTSGNTGIGLAAIAVPMGFRVIIVMPDSMSAERMKLMSAYGAELVLTDGKLGMKGAIAKAEEMAKSIPNSFIPGQFVNPDNMKAHYLTTGPEIFEDTDGKIDIFVGGIGTGGTISGTAKYLKEKNKSVKIVGIEPYDSPFITQGKAGSHGLQGLGAGFIPEILNLSLIDSIVTIKTEEAYEAGRMLGKCEGILAGISSGAALYAAIEEAKKPENKDKNIVVLLPDTGDRYLSTTMFDE